MYDNLDARTGDLVWTDLCRGPHLPRTSTIPAFSLTRSAAAYWRGSEKNPQLQRIYGTAWESKDAHKAYLERLAEAERRDHRRLGAELDLFSFPDEIGSGLAVFHPKGGVIKREMEDYVRARHIEEGFDYVGTPHITKGGLFETSGHLPYYEDTMFPAMDLENSEYYLKAMNCPMHNLIFRSRGRSYRELPLRFFEFGSVYRYEKSGVVHGLTRVRGLTQDDSHSYVTPEQAPDEIRHLLAFVLGLLRDFGLDDYYLELSTRGESDKFIGSDEEWAVATAVLEDAAKETGLELVPDPGGAAFYGPKISVQARDAIGRTWQMSTIQYDFNQPARFGLEYSAADGTRQQPVMIHSAKFGSIERFFGVLTEHYAGAFPAWLAPVQVVGIPITDEQVPYLTDVARQLRARGHPGRDRRLRRADAEEDPHRQQAEDPVRAARRRDRRRGRRGLLPLPRRVAAQRRPRGRGGRPGRRLGRGAPQHRPHGGRPGGRSMAGLGSPRSSVDHLRRRRRRARRRPSSTSGRRTGWPTSAVRASPRGARLPVLHRSRRWATRTGSSWPGGRRSTPSSTSIPYNAGHLMLVPYRHVPDYTDLTADEVAELGAFTQTAMRAVRAVSGAHGFNIGMNQGSVAGAGIADHLHQHAVPRWGGDTNFMPVIGLTRVLPQVLARDPRRCSRPPGPSRPYRVGEA